MTSASLVLLVMDFLGQVELKALLDLRRSER